MFLFSIDLGWLDGSTSAVKELISTGENFPERLDLAKMLKMFAEEF